MEVCTETSSSLTGQSLTTALTTSTLNTDRIQGLLGGVFNICQQPTKFQLKTNRNILGEKNKEISYNNLVAYMLVSVHTAEEQLN